MLKLPKIKILQNIKHNEEVKKVNSDDKVNKDIINKKQIKINPKNSDPIHSNNKNSKLDIKNYINEHKNNPQNNNNIIYESSIKAVNNNEPNVNASQFQDFLKFNKKEVINNNKEFLIDFETIKNENNNLKIKQPQNNLISENTLVSTIKINTLNSNSNMNKYSSSNMNKSNISEKTLVSNNLISNPIPNNLINNYQNYSINTNKTIHFIETNHDINNEKNDNNNNEINEKQIEKDLYDGQRYLIQISNLVENEQNEIDNDTIYNSDSFTNLVNVEELKEEDKITNSKNYKNDNKNNDNLTKSIITESGKKELNIEKKKLKKEFGKDFEKILNIFNENSNKKFFGYDENNIKSELLNQGFSNEIIEKVIKLAPEFFSLTVEKKMMEI